MDGVKKKVISKKCNYIDCIRIDNRDEWNETKLPRVRARIQSFDYDDGYIRQLAIFAADTVSFP